MPMYAFRVNASNMLIVGMRTVRLRCIKTMTNNFIFMSHWSAE